MYKKNMCRYHGGVLSQYVHIGYITHSLFDGKDCVRDGRSDFSCHNFCLMPIQYVSLS